ncbi:hypothetical protein GJ496_004357 [Pomphorhynchus laevis]|nr:hypothetical protein GJ496_004357 [Pomphorhynchus laevis]
MKLLKVPSTEAAFPICIAQLTRWIRYEPTDQDSLSHKCPASTLALHMHECGRQTVAPIRNAMAIRKVSSGNMSLQPIMEMLTGTLLRQLMKH